MTATRPRALAATAITGAFLLGFDLGGYALIDPDEAKHAEVAREMLVTGRWIEPLVNFGPYHHKPSPFYLLVGLGYRVFGVTEVGARCVSALAAWLTLLLVCAHGSRRDPREGLLAAFLLGSCAFFVGIGRFTNFDAPLTLALTAAVLALARLVEEPGRRSHAYVFHACIALAVLVKGPAALVLGAVPVALALARGDIEPGDLALGGGCALAAFIIGLWLVPALLVAPQYVADFLWVHNVERYLAGADADLFHPEPFWFYAPVIAAALLPWSPLLPGIVTGALGQRGADRFLAEYALWVVIFFSLSSGKLATYVVPAFPALAIVASRRLLLDAREGEKSAGRTALSVGAAACALLAPAAFVALRVEAPGNEWLACVLAPASVAGVVVACSRQLTTLAAVIASAAGMLLAPLLLVVFGTGAISLHVSDRDLAEVALGEGRPRRMLAYRVRPFSFQFYTGWPLVYRVPLDEVRRTLYETGRGLVLTEERWARHLEDAAPGVELRELARNPRHALYRFEAQWAEKGVRSGVVFDPAVATMTP